jgi:SAM-dependent methyltransferase
MAILNKLLKLLWRANPSTQRAFLAKISDVVHESILRTPYLAAKFYPYQPKESSYVLRPAQEAQTDATGLPIPPENLWWGYANTPEEYLAWGQDIVTKMKDVLQAVGVTLQPGNRILDFGCGSGIMIRWLLDLARAGEVWGVDISARHMAWCQQNLSPPFKFATTTSFPYLPFEDSFFDFIYAGSVFTHIADLAETWLLELKRVARPGGKLYFTVHDEHTMKSFLDLETMEDLCWKEQLLTFVREHQLTTSSFAMFTLNRTPGAGSEGQAQVFYNMDYLRRHWGNYLKVISVTPEAYGYQSAVLLEKSG